MNASVANATFESPEHLDAAISEACAGEIETERKASHQMEMAHKHMQKNARRRIVGAAKLWLVAVPEQSETLTRILKTMVVQRCIVPMGEVVGDRFKVHTIGMAALGFPELILDFPAELETHATELVHDLMAFAMNGERDKFSLDRHVFAARMGIAYRIDAADVDADKFCPEAALLFKQLATLPPCRRLTLVADRREGGAVVAAGPTAMAVYRKLRGIKTFTGLVQVSPPSLAWHMVDESFAMAKLVDPDGDIDGPCVILSPGEFLSEMQKYDRE